jgi:hypothetical protein
MGENSFLKKLRVIPKTKKALDPMYIYTWDKSLHFCGTTQIDEIIHPLFSHTIICAPLITDRVPVGFYSRKL